MVQNFDGEMLTNGKILTDNSYTNLAMEDVAGSRVKIFLIKRIAKICQYFTLSNVVPFGIPYSLKFLRVKIFIDFVDFCLASKILFLKILVLQG